MMILQKLADRKLDIVAALMLAAVVVLLTLLPSSALPRATWSDKVHHMIAFGALVLPIGLARPSKIWHAAALALALGAVIELIQPFFGRHSELADLMADAFGIACVVTLCLAGRMLRPRRVLVDRLE